MALFNNSRILTLVFLMGYAGQLVGAADQEPVDTYKIIFDAEDQKTARVEAEITIEEQTLLMAPWGHPDLPQGWVGGRPARFWRGEARRAECPSLAHRRLTLSRRAQHQGRDRRLA